MKTVIVIPARYASTRLPGKPLVSIAGKTLLQRVIAIAQAASKNDASVRFLVATDDTRIGEHAAALGAEWVLTPESCKTGTDRVRAAVAQLQEKPVFVLNLQGDAPFTPPDFLTSMIASFKAAPCDAVTPVTRLSWEELDKLRADKQKTPFSGTTAVFNDTTGKAFWFSKNVIPAIRKEQDLRLKDSFSPVWRHIGLYGYSTDMLERFETLPEGQFEKLEGLEQLRLVENGFHIRCVPVDYCGRPSMSGVDSPEDVARAEALIAKHGDPLP